MHRSFQLTAPLAVLAGLAFACATSRYYRDPGGRFHIETPMSMAIGTTSKGNVRMEPGNETVVTIDVVETDAVDLDGYMQAKLDADALAHGDVDDLSVAGLPAKRLEFRGGIDLGGGLPVFENLVAYLVKDGSTVYRLTCSGADGPFENFCIGAFDDMAMTFSLGG